MASSAPIPMIPRSIPVRMEAQPDLIAVRHYGILLFHNGSVMHSCIQPAAPQDTSEAVRPRRGHFWPAVNSEAAHQALRTIGCAPKELPLLRGIFALYRTGNFATLAVRRRLRTQLYQRFPMISDLLGVTGQGLLHRRLLALRLGAIFWVAARLVSFSLLGDSLMEDWRLGSRQRHRPARRNHVKLAGKQYHEAALLSDATCDPAGGITSSPLNVRAGGTDNRRAGILRDHQPMESGIGSAARDGQLRLDKERRAIDMALVNGDRAARGQPHPLRAHRFVLVVQPGYAEEHQQPVGSSHVLGQVGIGLHPALDAVCRHLVAPNEVAFNQDAPDRRVVVAVVGVIAEANQSAILEPHPH